MFYLRRVHRLSAVLGAAAPSAGVVLGTNSEGAEQEKQAVGPPPELRVVPVEVPAGLPLTTLRDAVERYGGAREDAELQAVLSHVMTTLVDGVCAWLASTPDPEGQPELLTAFWEMCHRTLVFVPGLLLALPCAPQLFALPLCGAGAAPYPGGRAARGEPRGA